MSQIEDLTLTVRVLQGTIQFPVAPTSRHNSGLQAKNTGPQSNRVLVKSQSSYSGSREENKQPFDEFKKEQLKANQLLISEIDAIKQQL